MIRNLLIIVLLLLPISPNKPQRKSVSLDSGSEWKRTEEWGVFSVYYGSATFEYDEDYWKKDFDYSIVISTNGASTPGTIEFPFGKLTIHEAGTDASLLFSTLEYEEREQYDWRPKSSEDIAKAIKRGARDIVSLAEYMAPTWDIDDSGITTASANIYVRDVIWATITRSSYKDKSKMATGVNRK